MKWRHGHTFVAGILTGLFLDQRAVWLIILGIVVGFSFAKLSTLIRMIWWHMNRRWAIRP